jgi:hypothetical protein
MQNSKCRIQIEFAVSYFAFCILHLASCIPYGQIVPKANPSAFNSTIRRSTVSSA